MTQFKKGEIHNPNGRPKGSSNKWSVEKLLKSLEKAKKNHGGVDFLDHFCDQAYSNDKYAVAILKKLLPDLKQIEMAVQASGFYAHKTPDQVVQEMDDLTIGEPEEGDNGE